MPWAKTSSHLTPTAKLAILQSALEAAFRDHLVIRDKAFGQVLYSNRKQAAAWAWALNAERTFFTRLGAASLVADDELSFEDGLDLGLGDEETVPVVAKPVEVTTVGLDGLPGSEGGSLFSDGPTDRLRAVDLCFPCLLQDDLEPTARVDDAGRGQDIIVLSATGTINTTTTNAKAALLNTPTEVTAAVISDPFPRQVFMSRLFNVVPSMLLIAREMDDKGTPHVVWLNDAMEDATGFRSEDIYFPPDENEAVPPGVAKLVVAQDIPTVLRFIRAFFKQARKDRQDEAHRRREAEAHRAATMAAEWTRHDAVAALAARAALSVSKTATSASVPNSFDDSSDNNHTVASRPDSAASMDSSLSTQENSVFTPTTSAHKTTSSSARAHNARGSATLWSSCDTGGSEESSFSSAAAAVLFRGHNGGRAGNRGRAPAVPAGPAGDVSGPPDAPGASSRGREVSVETTVTVDSVTKQREPVVRPAIEFRLILATGKHIWVRGEAAAISCPFDGTSKLVLTLVNVDERRSLRHQLEDERNVVSSIVAQLPVAVAVAQLDGKQQWNSEYARVLGARPGRGRSSSVISPTRSPVPNVNTSMGAPTGGDGKQVIQVPHLLASDGSSSSAASAASVAAPFTMGSSDCVLYRMPSDIDIVSMSSQSSSSLSPQPTVMSPSSSVNEDEVTDVTATSADAVTGTGASSSSTGSAGVAGDDYAGLLRRGLLKPYEARNYPLARTIVSGSNVEGERAVIHNTTTGEFTPVMISSSAVRTVRGELIAGVATIQDISSVVREEKAKGEVVAAEKAAAATRDLLSVASHESRTPLAAILAMTGFLEDGPLTVEQKECVDAIKESGRLLLTLITDLLDFNRIEAGKLELERRLFSPFELLRHVAKMMNSYGKARDVKVELSAPGDEGDLFRRCMVVSDSQRLSQIIFNLVSNACKFSNVGGTVAIKASAKVAASAAFDDPSGPLSSLTPTVTGGDGTTSLEEEEAQQRKVLLDIRVIDKGKGMPPAALNKIRMFQPFSQADTGTARKAGGFGLGLNISNRLLGIMGGKLHVDSEEGKGSTFGFTVTFQGSINAVPAGVPVPPGMPLTVRTPKQAVLAPLDLSPGLQHLQSSQPTQSPLGSASSVVKADSLGIRGSLSPRRAPSSLSNSKTKSECDLFRWQSMQPLGRDTSGSSKTTALPALRPSGSAALPPPHAAAAAAGGGGAAVIRRRRILVAEDNKMNQKIMLRYLAKLGYNTTATGAASDVTVVEDGKQAVDELKRAFLASSSRSTSSATSSSTGSSAFSAAGSITGASSGAAMERPYDLVLMDCQMPEYDGYYGTSAIRSLPYGGCKDVPVVAVTASSLQQDVDKTKACGFSGHLAKPFTADDLKSCLDRWLPATPQTTSSGNSSISGGSQASAFFASGAAGGVSSTGGGVAPMATLPLLVKPFLTSRSGSLGGGGGGTVPAPVPRAQQPQAESGLLTVYPAPPISPRHASSTAVPASASASTSAPALRMPADTDGDAGADGAALGGHFTMALSLTTPDLHKPTNPTKTTKTTNTTTFNNNNATTKHSSSAGALSLIGGSGDVSGPGASTVNGGLVGRFKRLFRNGNGTGSGASVASSNKP